jgi:thiosulfate reductase cytochrome b subunit
MSRPGYWYKRHPLPIRVMHWINFLALALLLMSGLQIFNAYPELHWGQSSYSGAPPLLWMGAAENDGGEPIGVTRVLGHEFETTGVLGLSRDGSGGLTERGFPSWATLPGDQWLAMGRRWHLFFIWVLVLNGLAYVVYSATTRHLSRDLVPTRTDWRTMGRSFLEHLRFKHPHGEAQKRYNPLQKLAYALLIFVLLPLIIITGWSLSPRLNTVWPGWVELLGGRQSGRTLHFLAAWLLVLFLLVHLFEVAITGFWNNIRSMITGRYRITTDSPPEHEQAQ